MTIGLGERKTGLLDRDSTATEHSDKGANPDIADEGSPL
jgi:hypothetical protein